MSGAQHTPGPWDCDMGDGNYWAVADRNGSTVACLVEPTPRSYARRYDLLPRNEAFELALANATHLGEDTPVYPHWSVQEANARLIAAAPLFYDMSGIVIRAASEIAKGLEALSQNAADWSAEEIHQHAQALKLLAGEITRGTEACISKASGATP